MQSSLLNSTLDDKNLSKLPNFKLLWKQLVTMDYGGDIYWNKYNYTRMSLRKKRACLEALWVTKQQKTYDSS
ncbi:26s proteasome non-atpase regulatory subunit 12 like protein a [Quercus suber]|uniref:26s proteasome non-atpase regulatory subunit 12 like protein a n=1 Tax=Quercus suber TaxID=58331 RepID=A0AAW0L9R2_QUESU